MNRSSGSSRAALSIAVALLASSTLVPPGAGWAVAPGGGPAPGLPDPQVRPATAGLEVPQERPVRLRLEARPGEAATYRYLQEIDLRMPREFGGDQRVESRLVVRQRAERVEETSIGYLGEVREVTVEMAGSPSADELDFSRFEGQRFRMTLDRRGRLQGITAIGDPGPGFEQLEQSMRQIGFPVLPPGPVRVGESWVDTARIDAAAMALPATGEIVSVSRVTLERLSRIDGRTVAELAVHTDFHFEPSGGAMPGMQVEVTGRRQDEVRFDVDRGRFLEARGNQEFELRMTIPGAPSSLSIGGTARSRAELLPEG